MHIHGCKNVIFTHLPHPLRRVLVVDKKRYRNLHRNRNNKLSLILPLHHALEPPLTHHHLYNFLMQTSFGPSWSPLMCQKQALSD